MKLEYILPIVLFLLIMLRVSSRGYFWRDKKGDKLSLKDFFKRWRRGIEGITPVQQYKTSLMGMWITITGIIAGIVVNALIRLENMWWWIEIILIGSLIITLIQLIGTYQKYSALKKADELMKEIQNG